MLECGASNKQREIHSGVIAENIQDNFIRLSLTPDAYKRGRIKFDRFFPNQEIICT